MAWWSRQSALNCVRSLPDLSNLADAIETAGRTERTLAIYGADSFERSLVATAVHEVRGSSDQLHKLSCPSFDADALPRALFSTASREAGLGYPGTSFLDEVECLPEPQQHRLAIALRNGDYVPVGSITPLPVRARVILGFSNRDPTRKSTHLATVAVLELEIPPLSSRPQDVEWVVREILKTRAPHLNLGPEVLDSLVRHRWSSGFAELESTIDRALFRAGSEAALRVDHLSDSIAIRDRTTRRYAEVFLNNAKETNLTLREVVEAVEAQVISDCLRRVDGNRSQAARELDISRSNLIAKIRKYELE